MIGLDTNILLRFLVDLDDDAQTRRARDLVLARCTAADPGYVNAVVLAEFSWVLRSVYGFPAGDVLRAVESLLVAENLELEDHAAAQEAVNQCRRYNTSFADAFIGLRNRARGCQTTVTFDKKCLRLPDFQSPMT